jgi:geranylgeranyl reductase family protein
MIYDAIIVGTGPAGATAAYELSRRGFRVMALEKKRHPRYKVCGGGLSVRVDHLLGEEYHAVLEQRIARLVMGYRDEPPFEVPFDAPFAYMMMRDRFDAYLSDRARRAGCEIREDEPAVGFEMEDGTVTVKTVRAEYRARTLIGADGVPSLVAKRLFPSGSPAYAVALEGETPPATGRRWSGDSALIDVGAVRWGYAWIFPKGDHLSSGAATFDRGDQDIRRIYARFSEEHPVLPPIVGQSVAGHLLPRFTRRSWPLVHRQALLVGDAAGLVDPFLGEGIYYAIRSGLLAAEAVSGFIKEGRPLSSYEQSVQTEIHPELLAASKIARVVYRFPSMVYRWSSRRPGWLVACGRVLQGRLSYQELWRRCTDLRGWFGLRS